jgi:hypothetical protein
MTSRLTALEEAAMRELLRGDHPGLEIVRRQLQSASVSRRETDSAGFFTYFDVPQEVERLPKRERISFQDVMGSVNGGFLNASFSLVIEAGVLTMLEGFPSDGGQWPKEIATFEVPELLEERELSKLGPT